MAPIIHREPTYQCDFCSIEYDPEKMLKPRSIKSITIATKGRHYIANCICGKCSEALVEAVTKVSDHNMKYLAGMKEV